MINLCDWDALDACLTRASLIDFVHELNLSLSLYDAYNGD